MPKKLHVQRHSPVFPVRRIMRESLCPFRPLSGEPAKSLCLEAPCLFKAIPGSTGNAARHLGAAHQNGVQSGGPVRRSMVSWLWVPMASTTVSAAMVLVSPVAMSSTVTPVSVTAVSLWLV